LKKIEDGKGIIVRFVIGRRFKFLFLDLYGLGSVGAIGTFLICYIYFCSENRGDNLDADIARENRLTNDFIILVCSINLRILSLHVL